MENNERMKVYINNPSTVKQVAEGVLMDIHGNIFIFNEEYHVKQYTEEFDLRVIGRITPYQTVIINVEDAYKSLFGDISDEKVEVKAPECNKSDVEEATEDTETPAPLKSDKWVKQKYARYNYRLLKEAYLMVMNNMGSMAEISEATGVGPTTLSNMCRKKIHVDFTDALDEENGFGKYKSKSRKRTDASTIEAVYIENKLLGMSVDTISSRRRLAPITVTRIINAETKTAKKVIDECMRSGRYEAARKKIEASKESEV